MLQSPRNQGRDLQSDVTFNMRSPEISGMVYNAEDIADPNGVYGRRWDNEIVDLVNENKEFWWYIFVRHNFLYASYDIIVGAK